MINLIGKNLTAGYGGLDIIKNISINVKEGEVVVIVGPNGAGKSTVMKALLGMLKLTSGSVEFSDQEITKLIPKNRVSLGMKQLEDDPWEKVKDVIELGNKYTGNVTNIADYGVFVDLGKS